MKVALSTPIRSPRGDIKEIVLRAPRYGDYMDLGLPIQWVSVNADGGGFEQETPSLVRAWIERLADIDPNLLETLDLRDTFALRDAVFGFFREARRSKISDDTPASSPSDGSSTFVPSVI